MNQVTKDIAEMMNVSLEVAAKIQYQMECNDVDFSGCTKAQFKKEVKYAMSDLGM